MIAGPILGALLMSLSLALPVGAIIHEYRKKKRNGRISLNNNSDCDIDWNTDNPLSRLEKTIH